MLLILYALGGLYDDAMHVMKVRDFTLVSSDNFYTAIEFFAGWCGHCQAFAPIWKEVATRACAASPTLRIGAVDCVADFLSARAISEPGRRIR